MFSSYEYQKRYFYLSVNEGCFRFTQSKEDCMKETKKQFGFADVLAVIDDFSQNGRKIDFSGERQYPFPFGVRLRQRTLTLAAKTREDRQMWLNAFKLFYVVRCLHEGQQMPEPPKPEPEKRSKSMMNPALRNTIG